MDRAFGIWRSDTKRWMHKTDGTLIHYPIENIAIAQVIELNQSEFAPIYEARQFGDNGLPIGLKFKESS